MHSESIVAEHPAHTTLHICHFMEIQGQHRWYASTILSYGFSTCATYVNKILIEQTETLQTTPEVARQQQQQIDVL